jgi:pheromone shutdown protein TraB
MDDKSIIDVKGSKVYILGVVRGLKSEAEKVAKAVVEFKPDLVAMSISKEEIAGLRDYIKEPYEVEMSRYEELYAKNLAKFGDVFLPPPCFLAGIEEGSKAGVEVVGIDMDDETHSAAYCALVSGGELFRHTTRYKFLSMRGYKAETPEEFAVEWDKRVNNLKGFKELERERELFMAEELRKVAINKSMILAIVDSERASGVQARLS